MTTVRQRAKTPGEATAGAGRLAQVRLRPAEVKALKASMRTLHLRSTSDALREGLRLLAREAAEVQATEDLRAFYAGRPAPLPDAVTSPTEAELAAADQTDW